MSMCFPLIQVALTINQHQATNQPCFQEDGSLAFLLNKASGGNRMFIQFTWLNPHAHIHTTVVWRLFIASCREQNK